MAVPSWETPGDPGHHPTITRLPALRQLDLQMLFFWETYAIHRFFRPLMGVSGTAVIVMGGGCGVGCGAGVKMVMYVVTTLGDGPGTSNRVVIICVAILEFCASSSASSVGMHWEYHSLRDGLDLGCRTQAW